MSDRDISCKNPEFSVRIVVCDHYLAKPVPGIDVIYSEFRGSDIKQVPVLRIFGATSEGHKACLHVHGVFPYFYIPCPTSNPEPQYLYQIAASLDKALNIALKQATSANQHVYKITLVKGLPFYGYHDKEHLYLKIFLYTPGLIKQAVELCSNGAILGQSLQPHESHLNFTLQFFIDFNLFGMSNIDLQAVKFRKTGISQDSNDPFNSDEFRLKPESSCFYEADCVASHIINRQRIGKGDGIENPGLEEVWNQEIERRKQLNASIASKSLSQGRIKDNETESHYKFQQIAGLKLNNLIDKPVNTNEKVLEAVYYPAESLEGSDIHNHATPLALVAQLDSSVVMDHSSKTTSGTQLFNAVDVSIHLPEHTDFSETRRDFDDTLVGDVDTTIVDEDVALNCSLHYSQVLLNSQDLDLVDMLQDMDSKPIEADSVMAAADADSEDDAEYSKAFDDDTVCLNQESFPITSEDLELVDMLQDMDSRPLEDDSVMMKIPSVWIKKDEEKETNDSPVWNDSFWDGANIPQLDGTFDDEHVKKVRKRKMRPLKIGLSRPKAKKTTSNSSTEAISSTSQIDEINVSRDTIENISSNYIRKASSKESDSVNSQQDEIKNELDNVSIVDLVNKISKEEHKVELNVAENKNNLELNLAKVYDIQNEFVPEAGPSEFSKRNVNKSISNIDIDSDTSPEAGPLEVNKTNVNKSHNTIDINTDTSPEAGPSEVSKTNVNKSISNIDIDTDSSPEDKSGIMSFYTSKVFNLSQVEDDIIEDSDIDKTQEYEEIPDYILPSDDTKLIQIESQNTHEEADEILLTANKHNHEEIKDISLIKSSNKTSYTKVLTPRIKPPTKAYITNTLEQYNIPKVTTTVPFFSNYKDVGDRIEVGQILLKLQSKLAFDQKPYEKVLNTTSLEEWRQLIFLQNNELSQESKPEELRKVLAGNRSCILEPVNRPPTFKEVEMWVKNKDKVSGSSMVEEVSNQLDELDNSQALGLHYDATDTSISLESTDKDKSNLDSSMQVTMQPDGSFLCFGGSSQKETSVINTPTVEVNFLTLMLIEVHTSIRGDFHPDPRLDAIQAVFINVTNDCPANHFLSKNTREILVVDDKPSPKYLEKCVFDSKITYFNTEIELIEFLIQLIKNHDPDIMCGYEIEMSSWGYVLERSVILGLDIVMEVSRIVEKFRQKRVREGSDFEGRIIGRIMFNVWRLFRHELALSSYSFENCMYEVLKERVPKYSYAELSEWWTDESRIRRWIPVEYYMTRLVGTVRMLEKLDIINRTSELARLFGLQWWEVLSRGSQFRVESLMLRAARPLNLIALSPTVKQRAAMRAPECLPLIFEPESRFYKDPMIVLDFQSLYPSMMIAYNYCFSTCIGRVQNINGDASYEFGAWRLRISKQKLETLINEGLVHWSPVGVGFVKSSVRRGVLPALLRRILAARQAVKKNMKLQTDEGVKKAMHSRQLGLKLIANVTYGYTAANFSGRMPCVEVGDSVVAKGRETLEMAIKLVRNNNTWNVKVVYGDTDSMFVLVPGRSRAEAFRIGQEIADAVTADNPSPVALKLEKVYQPCILQTKKRYVGYMYESPEQQEPVYEAKGIETVRRDGCPAGVKLLQRALCELFTHGDMSIVKRQVCEQLSKLASGDMPIQELFFTREYHGSAGYRPGATAPPNEIAKRISIVDGRAAPRAGWRVSWAVCSGAPGTALCRLARSPEELARSPAPPHVAYYVARVLLPPLQRCLSLLGADVFKWWRELGYTRESGTRTTNTGIAKYLCRDRCITCGARTNTSICGECAKNASKSAATVAVKGNQANSHLAYCYTICATCCGHDYYPKCENTECPVLWRRITAQQKLTQIRDVVTNLPSQFNREMFEF